MDGYLRGQVAKKANLHMETLRFYERNGLLPPPERNAAGYRVYPEEALLRLEFIKQAKEAGFSLEEIKQLMAIAGAVSGNIDALYGILESKMQEIEAKLAALKKIMEILRQAKQNLHGENRCLVLQTLLNGFAEK